jgi:hypothetical protein
MRKQGDRLERVSEMVDSVILSHSAPISATALCKHLTEQLSSGTCPSTLILRACDIGPTALSCLANGIQQRSVKRGVKVTLEGCLLLSVES